MSTGSGRSYAYGTKVLTAIAQITPSVVSKLILMLHKLRGRVCSLRQRGTFSSFVFRFCAGERKTKNKNIGSSRAITAGYESDSSRDRVTRVMFHGLCGDS